MEVIEGIKRIHTYIYIHMRRVFCIRNLKERMGQEERGGGGGERGEKSRIKRNCIFANSVN